MSNEKNMSLFDHLEDLRRLLVVSLVSVLITSFGIFFAFKDPFMDFLLAPMHRMDIDIVILAPAEAFITQIKASVFAGILVALPIILWQIWSFIMPALHYHERRPVVAIVPASFVLFLAGVSFAYYMVFPLAIIFLIGVAGEGISPMISLSRYVSFLISFCLPFGLVFQLPLVILLLTKLGIVTPAFLAEKRKYAILVIAVLSATLTPPDVISMMLMAGPMVLFYEIGIILARIFTRKKIETEIEKVEAETETEKIEPEAETETEKLEADTEKVDSEAETVEVKDESEETK
ncbi:MAG: twin-arginine translocase subunit TatC [Clostridia bacterium]|nr:twin-arginine translocase subunit TatC [Clostridia bacterium]